LLGLAGLSVGAGAVEWGLVMVTVSYTGGHCGHGRDGANAPAISAPDCNGCRSGCNGK
jgi:hypothetical protein